VFAGKMKNIPLSVGFGASGHRKIIVDTVSPGVLFAQTERFCFLEGFTPLSWHCAVKNKRSQKNFPAENGLNLSF